MRIKANGGERRKKISLGKTPMVYVIAIGEIF
jgi:hypothetical protein